MMRRLHAFYLALILVFAVFVATAVRAQNRAEAPVVWSQMPGSATDISINSVGQAYVTGPDGTPWRWDRTEQRWRRMSGKFVRISAAQENHPWAINPDGVVFYYNGLWWEDKAKDVIDIAADSLGNVYVVKTDGQIQKWYALRSEWQPFTGNARRIAIDVGGQPWVITATGTLRAFDGKAWLTLPGLARDIAINGANVVAIADGEGLVRQWHADTHRWNVIDGINNVTALAVTPEGQIWAVAKDGIILANGGLVDDSINPERDAVTQPKAKQAKAIPLAAPVDIADTPFASVPNAATTEAPPISAEPPVIAASQSGQAHDTNASRPDYMDPVTITTKDPFTFTNTQKIASTLAIGADGSVFGLDAGGNILRWSNRKKQFDSFPGTLLRLSVDKDGHPWGVSALGRVFRHDGTRWRQIYNATASDISVGFDGTVLVINAAGRLYRLNDTQTRFEPIPGTSALLVATGPDGTPWTIRTDKRVQRCDVTPCKVYPQKAKAISVGPDGSVFIVSDSNRLMRLNPDDNNVQFDIIPTAGHIPVDVVVGPMGFPWVVSDNGFVLASTFFDRDETTDSIEAATTSDNGTTGTGATAPVVSNSSTSSFTFSKNIKFETVPAPNLTFVQALRFASDIDGIIWASVNGVDIQKYSKTKRQFVNANTQFDPNQIDILEFDIAPNGDIWAYAFIQQSSVLVRQHNRAIKQYTVAGAEPISVALSPDGTVFAIFDFGSDRYLYSKAPNAEKFTRFSTDNEVYKVSVGPGNDVWIIDSTNIVKQWDGSRFQRRPAREQLANRISVGKTDGTVYIVATDFSLRKWNGINQSFDQVNNISPDEVAVDGDGRPWIYDVSSGDIKRAKK
jgi:hypothetical protein